MAHHSSFSVPFLSGSAISSDSDLTWPFGHIDGLDAHDIRETAYEIFFTSCRSSPGFGGGRNAIQYFSRDNNGDNGGNGGGGGSPTSPGKNPGGLSKGIGPVVMITPASKIKRTLGLKMIRRSPSRRMSSIGAGGSGGANSAPNSPSGLVSYGGPLSPSPGPINGFLTVPPSRPRRPLTSAEIMRMQMKVTEQSDNRLRKTLMRTLVGQMGKRAETIILPLELLRHVKPSEFNDSHEYHLWQRRQLKVLEAGLLNHPSIPLDRTNTYVLRLREIIHSSESKPIETNQNSDTMRTLCNVVVSLAWRSPNGTPSDVCHWADGFPLNIHLYVSLLRSIFDFRDETLVLDEVDELIELMKKTWSTLGISRSMHNLCLTWVLFQQYVLTEQTEPDLLYAAHSMLSTEVANDLKKPDREVIYSKLLSSMLVSMQGWAERRLLNYHDYFQRGNMVLIENLLPLALSASKISGGNLTISEGQGQGLEKRDTTIVDISGDRVDHYIRSSIKQAFAKIIETGSYKSTSIEVEDEGSEALIQLAKETQDLALRERECFSPILKKWHPIAPCVAAATLHQCYGAVLRQYLNGTSTLNMETVEVLQAADKLEKALVQLVVEDSVDCEDGGKSVVREMVPYEVDSVIFKLMTDWVEGKLKNGRECILRARDSETWNPKSKSEPYAVSVVELIDSVKEVVEDFFNLPITLTDDLIYDLAEGLDSLFQDYISFVSSCGSKQSYLPSLPPLTRCNRDSRILKLWKRASPCSVSLEDAGLRGVVNDTHHPRPSTSRGTQRLYIRLNSLHYILSHLHSLEKALVNTPKSAPSHACQRSNGHRRRNSASSYFGSTHNSIQAACQYVSEVASYRLIFLDSGSAFYDSLYASDVPNSRIRPALRSLKQNLTLMTAILTDRAQPLALREVMKASFECFLMVLLAGGSRVYFRSDHPMIREDFECLKRIFCACGEGLINEQTIDKEAETVEGVITLMAESSEQLIDNFSIVACETSGMGVVNPGQKLPMPPTTGRWNRADPNTILRVLCHRNDKAANHFLKKSFQLAKRK